jgi:hypothetical protein
MPLVGVMEKDDFNMLNWAVGILMGIHSRYGDVNVLIYHDSIRVLIEQVEKPYNTSPEGDQFLRSFLINWMMQNKIDVPAAATPRELLDAIERHGRR